MDAGGILADRYQLVEPIGTGAQGTVWRAVDRRDGTDVALKVFGTRDVESLLRLVCEQSVRIAHPHVLVPLDWFVREGEGCLVLPLVRGGTLAGLLADYGELPAAVGLLIAEQLLDALVCVHSAGLVHRDVKPSNLLLAATGSGRPHIFLADFGVARIRPHLQLTSRSVTVGTPDYLAPEVLAGEGSSPAQDIYAAGLVIAQLNAPAALVAAMTSHLPGPRPSAAAARDEIARTRAALGPEDWPVEWEGDAFSVLDQLSDHPLPQAHLGGPTLPLPQAPRTAASGTPSRKRRRTVWAGAAVGCAVTITAAAVAAVVLPGDGARVDSPRRTPDEAPSGAVSPAHVVPSDADTGVPDPGGPAAFSRCEAKQQFAMRVSPEGYLLFCTHVPDTRAYEWTPRGASE